MIRLSRSQLAVSVLEIGVRAPQLDDERAAHAQSPMRTPPLTLATLWHFSERKSTASPRARACITGSPPLHDELAAEHLSQVGQKVTHGEARATPYRGVGGAQRRQTKTPPPGTYRCSSMQRTLSGPSPRRWHAQDAARPPTAIPQGLAGAAKTLSPRQSLPVQRRFKDTGGSRDTHKTSVKRHPQGEPGHTRDTRLTWASHGPWGIGIRVSG